MKLRPTIFLSGVSHELGAFRDAVETEIQKKGCFPENQPSFAPDYRTVEEMLRRKLSEADAVIHIVGFRFGAEPKERPADKPRRSYTQMEFDIAHELKKPVYVFLSSDANVRDAAKADEQPEDAEATALELAHRTAIQNADNLYDFFKDKSELCRKVAQIPIVAATDFRADISRIIKYAPEELIGREDEFKLLDDAWLKVRRAESQRPHILTFVALGGEGKTSLVSKWAAELAFQSWPGCDSVFAWSFYSQGTREQIAPSSDLFLKEGITFFGNEADKEFAASSAGAYEKGQRLARIVSERRSLLILDGLEPLQYAPTSPIAGELKDSGVAALLKGLAADSDGLCIVTTRYSLPDLRAFWQTTAPEVELLRLSRESGVHLLKTLEVNGTLNEFETLVEDVKGHALTLNLLGTYLRDAHGGDIRRRDRVKLEDADAEEQGGHAFRVMEAYERAFEDEGDKGRRARAVLQLLGLFDRPISADCLAALLEKPRILGLTDPLIGLSEAQLNVVFKRLEDAKVITINREASGALVSLDAHPLLREYFAELLRTQKPDTWRTAHRRLYEHLCATTPDKPKPALEDLQPLYQAVAHGCLAGLQKEAHDEVYDARITRGGERYTVKKLGVFASDLGAVACFFEQPWSQVSLSLLESDQASMLERAAFRLRALGRLTEALEPMRAALEMGIKQANWEAAAIRANNLTQLDLMLGRVTEAVLDAEQAVNYADRSLDTFQQLARRATHAYALHQAGHAIEARTRFREAEQIQRRRQPAYPLLYSLRGFLYCDLLLATPERAAWQRTLECRDWARLCGDKSTAKSPHSGVLCEVSERAAETLKIAMRNNWLLTIGLHHLLLGRVALCEAVFGESGWAPNAEDAKLKTVLDDAVNGLRCAGDTTRLPLGLLTRAWLRLITGVHTGPESAQEDLDEAWEIAERGPMRLFMADIHLYRARLFFREAKYPWDSPQADLEAAKKLINDCGYHRRDEELADAKRVILGQSV
jgi:DNA-binding transcriptional ArsR family regulator